MEQALAESLPVDGRKLKRKTPAAAASVAKGPGKKVKGKSAAAQRLSDMPSMDQIAQEVAELHGQRG